MFLLDSDIATLVMNGHERVTARLTTVDPAQVALTLVTRLEMLSGRIDAILKAATADELLRGCRGLVTSEDFIGKYQVVLITEAVADRFEQLRVMKKLNKMDRGDRLQAAIALANDATLVTRNTKDYANVPNLKVENWAA